MTIPRLSAVVGAIVLLSISSVYIGNYKVCFAEDAPSENQNYLPDDAPQTAADIERAINGLFEPIDQEKIDQLLFGISQVEDRAEGERLEALLNEQVAKQFQGDAAEPEFEPSSTAEATDEGIEARIGSMSIDPAANPHQRAERERVLGAVKSIQDTERREKFLKQLEEREGEAGSIVTEAENSDSQPEDGDSNDEEGADSQ